MDQNSSFDIPLHDIKPLVEVSDNSYYLFLAVVIFGAIVLLLIIYFTYNYFKKRKKLNIRKESFELLKNIDFSDPKRAAYNITKYGALFEKDSTRVQEAYQNLNGRLSSYKYKKEVDEIDEEAKGYYNIFIGMIDV